jgi:hypothetical protein
LENCLVLFGLPYSLFEQAQAMPKNAVALPYMEQALALATFVSGVYEVAKRRLDLCNSAGEIIASVANTTDRVRLFDRNI